jgi:type I restriction enzyme M protein
VFKQARLAARYSEDAVEALRGRRDFGDALVQILKDLDGTPWNLIPKRLPAAAKAAGLQAPAGLIDAVLRTMAVPDETAPPAVDRNGHPVLAGGWKITERVPMSEDLDEHMR